MIMDTDEVLFLATILFALGLLGLLARRNVLFMLISIEIMLNAAGLAFVAAGAQWMEPDGQVMFLFVLAVAAAEVSVGLGLILWLFRQHKSLDGDQARDLASSIGDQRLGRERTP